MKKAIIIGLYIVCAMVLESAIFVTLGFGSYPDYFMPNLVILIGLGALLFCIPWHIPTVLLATVFLVVQSALGVASVNFSEYNIGGVFSWDLLKLTDSQGLNPTLTGFINFWSFTRFIAVVIIYVGLCIPVLHIKSARIPFKPRTALVLSMFIMCTSIILPSAYRVHVASLNTHDRYIHDSMDFKVSFYRKFGTFATYVNNIFLGKEFGLTKTATKEQYEEYFSKDVPYAHGQHWGADAGNNLVTILLESFDSIFIDPTYTPTLYGLMQGGINFKNHHNLNDTHTSERAVMLGSYPMGYWVDVHSKGARQSVDFAIANQLLKNGFDTANYFLPTDGRWFHMNKTHPSYGLDSNFLYLNDTAKDYNYGTYTPDPNWYPGLGDPYAGGWTPLEYVRYWLYPERWFWHQAIDDILPTNGDRFFSFMSTGNAHGDYASTRISPMVRYYMNKITANISHEHKIALAMAMHVEDGVKYLMSELNNPARASHCGKPGCTGTLAHHTTLMFFSDHIAYSNYLSTTVKGIRPNKSPLYNINAFIVSPNVKNVEVTKFTTHYDLSPTVLGLLGIPLNSQFYYGYDAFGAQTPETTSIMVSRFGGVFNDKFFTDDGVTIRWQKPDATAQDFADFRTQAKIFLDRVPYFNALHKYGTPS